MAYISKGNHAIVLDLSDVTFIDSSGLGALIASLKAIDEDGELILSGVRDTVESMFMSPCRKDPYPNGIQKSC